MKILIPDDDIEDCARDLMPPDENDISLYVDAVKIWLGNAVYLMTGNILGHTREGVLGKAWELALKQAREPK